MKSLERRFKNFSEKDQGAASYICFVKAIAGQRFSRQTLHRWFYKLVEKSDYAKNEVKEILRHLENLSKGVEDNIKQG